MRAAPCAPEHMVGPAGIGEMQKARGITTSCACRRQSVTCVQQCWTRLKAQNSAGSSGTKGVSCTAPDRHSKQLPACMAFRFVLCCLQRMLWVSDALFSFCLFVGRPSPFPAACLASAQHLHQPTAGYGGNLVVRRRVAAPPPGSVARGHSGDALPRGVGGLRGSPISALQSTRPSSVGLRFVRQSHLEKYARSCSDRRGVLCPCARSVTHRPPLRNDVCVCVSREAESENIFSLHQSSCLCVGCQSQCLQSACW